ncbi:LamG-like jellyroll fold domain-containing protein [Nonomuraea sp. NPDC050643]|uniref:LamG-like jellyroll fold domain-containing protein n=1 Tax=Nonomuraea sp. NPDC050643 TaxID=3155660 RepID=UPI0033CABB68
MKLSRLLAAVAAGVTTLSLLSPPAQAAPPGTAATPPPTAVTAVTPPPAVTAVVTPPAGRAEAIRRLDPAVRVEAGVETVAGRARDRLVAVDRDTRGHSVVYVHGDTRAALARAVAAAGGVITDGTSDLVRASVPRDRLLALAGQAGVKEVRRPDTAVPMALLSEGAIAAGAPAWHEDGKQGAGVKVGILDVGFGRLEAAQAGGELPATGITTYDGSCGPEHASSHGTTMAEVVHDMAPRAELYLACVKDTLDFDDAARWLKEQGVRVVNISLAFPGVARGDGAVTPGGADWSPAGVVRWLRASNVLVVAAAGNEAEKHWGGTFTDDDQNGWITISGASEALSFTVHGGSEVTLELKWDAWPTTTTDVDLYVMPTAIKPDGPNDPRIVAKSIRPQAGTPAGLSPVETVKLAAAGEEAVTYFAYVQVKEVQMPSAARYGLTAYGNASGFSYTSGAGTIAEPATSPAALTVGAMRPEATSLERYSGRGPTIDGRRKPELASYTGVSTLTGGTGTRKLTGTSVAAAHVSGAAALLFGANPALDASQAQAELTSRTNPADLDDDWGHGLMELGPVRVPSPPRGSAYTPLPLRRVLDTFGAAGGHPGPLVAGEEFSLRIDGLPDDVTAVALQLTGFEEDLEEAQTTRLEVYPYKGRPTGVAAMEVTAGRVGETMVIATVDPADEHVRIRNAKGSVHLIADLVGYFSPTSSASTFFGLEQPAQIQDTRTYGTANAKYGPEEQRRLQIRGVAGVPADATAVQLNLTASEASVATHLQVFTSERWGAWTLSPYPGDELTHTIIVPIAEDGSVRILNEAGTVHLAVDLIGWFGRGDGARYVPLQHPARVLDTETGMSAPPRRLDGGQRATVTVGGLGTVPYAATGAVVSVRPGTAPRAGRSRVGVWASEFGWSGQHLAVSNGTRVHQQSNMVLTPLGAGRTLDVRNNTGQVHVGLDLWGYFVGGGAVAPGPLPAANGWWRFDEGSGSTIADSSGGGRTATRSGGMTWSGGRAGGNSGRFDGTGFAATSGPVLRTDQSFTVAAWVALERSDGWFTVASQDGRDNAPFVLQYSDDVDRWTFSTTSGEGSNPAVVRAAAPTPPLLGRWTHLAGVYDAQARQTRLYVNGALAGQRDGVTMWQPATPGPFVIGAAKWLGSRVDHFPGLVDDVRAYAGALTEHQIKGLHTGTPLVGRNAWAFDEGTGTVAKSSGWPDQNMTLSAGAGWTDGVSGKALALDGTAGAYATSGQSEVEIPGPYTVSAWARLTGTGSTQTVFSQDGGDVHGLALQFRHLTNRWVLSLPASGAVGPQTLVSSAEPPTVGRWTHLVATYDTATRQARLYVDGVLAGIADTVAQWPSGGAAQVGRARWGGAYTEPFRGAIDDVRTWMGAAAPAEVLRLYRERVPG